MVAPHPTLCYIHHKDDGTVVCETHGFSASDLGGLGLIHDHIREARAEWRKDQEILERLRSMVPPEKDQELLEWLRTMVPPEKERGVRSEEEIRKALEFWKRAPTSTEEPKPIEVLIKGIVWTLEWVLGRNAGEIASQASNETWFKRTVEEDR